MTFLMIAILLIAILVIAATIFARALGPASRPPNRESRPEDDDLEELVRLDLLSDGKLDGRIEPP